MIQKPESIKANPFKSNKWDEITHGKDFPPMCRPTLELLCEWHYVLHQCISELDKLGSLTHTDVQGRSHAHPEIDIMKKASGEIRQLNKQLGINDTAEPVKEANIGASVIQLATSRRQERRTRATA